MEPTTSDISVSQDGKPKLPPPTALAMPTAAMSLGSGIVAFALTGANVSEVIRVRARPWPSAARARREYSNPW